MRRALLLLPLLLGCSAAPPSARVATQVEVPGATTAAPAEARATTPPPPPREVRTPAQAFAEASALLEPIGRLYAIDDEDRAKLAAAGLADEQRVASLLQDALAPCLASLDEKAPACVALRYDGRDLPEAKTAETLMEILGDLATPSDGTGPSASVRLLLQLAARGSYEAEKGVQLALERRASARLGPCVPPNAEEMASARQTLGAFLVVDGATGKTRIPSPTEAEDLAYLFAATREAGPEVGSAVEDEASPRLPAGSPVFERREALREAMRVARMHGDPQAHLDAALAYLGTLGYPHAIRVNEEGNMRWGGAAYSYVMRDAAESAELLGRLDLAASLARRANPGGGSCGTSYASTRDEQLQRVIRTEEAARGCRAVVAERLFSVAGGEAFYGPARLEKSGFDVERLYRGALATTGRRDAEALRALFERTGDFTSGHRLVTNGPEAWAERVRAIRGYADAAGGDAIPTLLDVARRGDALEAAEAIEAIGDLAEHPPYDPCDPGTGFGRGSWSSALPRKVRAVNDECATKLTPAATRDAVRGLASFWTHKSPDVRQAVAEALGMIGTPEADQALRRGERDAHAVEGSCTGDCAVPPKVYPVRDAARQARAELARAARTRADRERERRADEAKP